jgi:hypothetical protein
MVSEGPNSRPPNYKCGKFGPFPSGGPPFSALALLLARSSPTHPGEELVGKTHRQQKGRGQEREYPGGPPSRPEHSKARNAIDQRAPKDKAGAHQYKRVKVLRRWVRQKVAHFPRQSICVVEHSILLEAQIVDCHDQPLSCQTRCSSNPKFGELGEGSERLFWSDDQSRQPELRACTVRKEPRYPALRCEIRARGHSNGGFRVVHTPAAPVPSIRTQALVVQEKSRATNG